MRLRASPTTAAPILLTTTAPRNYCTIMGLSAPADDSPHQWLKIRGDDGLEAWVRADVCWRVVGDFRLLPGGKAYDTLVAGVEAFPPIGAPAVQPPATAPSAPPASAAKWAAPMTGYVVTTPFNAATHPGIDMAAPMGTPIYNRGAGVVFSADDCPDCPGGNGAVLGTSNPKTQFGFGVNVVIRHAYADLPATAQRAMDAANCTGGWLYVRYAHLQKRFVNKDASVSAGTLLGWLGTSGNSSGPHCHVEARASLLPTSANVFAEKLIDPCVLFTI